MATTVQALQRQLVEAVDGTAAFDAFEALARHADNGERTALQILIDYARSGKFAHVRGFISSALAERATAGDAPLLAFFKEGLRDPIRGYWSVLGYLRVGGRKSYPDLVATALDPGVPLDQRAHAVKCLAQHADQRFDRGAPPDPGHWSEKHIRTAEIRAWMEADYPSGAGYSKPPRDPALDSPKSPFERLVARLDRKLDEYRKRAQDPANPSSWLTQATAADLQAIQKRWKLPPIYLDFLARFSPLRVYLEEKRFVNGLTLFGAADLIAGQDGYSESSSLKKVLEGWPAHLIVIGTDGGDPYVLDLAHIHHDDAPVMTAMHGTGEWNFVPIADSFTCFLELLTQ